MNERFESQQDENKHNDGVDRLHESARTESLLRSFRPRRPMLRSAADIAADIKQVVAPIQPQPIVTSSQPTKSTRYAMAFVATFAGGAIAGALCMSAWMQFSQPNAVDSPATTAATTLPLVKAPTGNSTHSAEANETKQSSPSSPVPQTPSVTPNRAARSAAHLADILGDPMSWPASTIDGSSSRLLAGSHLIGLGVVPEVSVSSPATTETSDIVHTVTPRDAFRRTPAKRNTNREMMHQLLNGSDRTL